MAGCGYVCAVCEGKGLDSEGELCDYCKENLSVNENDNNTEEKKLQTENNKKN
ncbi:MAG: hypothetical protein K2X86_17800 [Cytophagaceae bacterium]|nr:hypothetical protein [Cytophagaceae bacterium]